jgi:hypothetical protein
MAQAKKSRPNQKKKTAQTRFYVVQTAQQTRKRVSDKLEDYNQSYIEKPIKNGKALVEDLKKAPRKTLNEVWDDGKARIDDLREDTQSRVADLKADTRSFIEGIGKDARLVVDEVVSGSRQALDKVPGKQKLEKEVRSRINAFPAQLNLPSKKDIDGLVRRLDRLNKKVDALQRTVAA